MGTDFIPQSDFLKSGRFFSYMLPITVKFLFFCLNESVVKKKALTTQGSTLFLLFWYFCYAPLCFWVSLVASQEAYFLFGCDSFFQSFFQVLQFPPITKINKSITIYLSSSTIVGTGTHSSYHIHQFLKHGRKTWNSEKQYCTGHESEKESIQVSE